MTELELKFRYAKDEKFYQTRNLRYPITFDALIFNFSHVMAKKDLLGSSYDYHRTDIGIQKRFWFSAFGYVDLITKAGKVWNKVPYPLLILPNANLSYTIQPESYTNHECDGVHQRRICLLGFDILHERKLVEPPAACQEVEMERSILFPRPMGTSDRQEQSDEWGRGAVSFP